jgi:hypothetical protein
MCYQQATAFTKNNTLPIEPIQPVAKHIKNSQKSIIENQNSN